MELGSKGGPDTELHPFLELNLFFAVTPSVDNEIKKLHLLSTNVTIQQVTKSAKTPEPHVFQLRYFAGHILAMDFQC